MNQHPPGSINNPLHASTLNRLVDATDYRSGSGKQWIRTVCGTAFHALMRDYLTTRKITKDCLAYLKEAIAAERDGVEWGRDQNEPWAWGLIHHWFTAITTKWAPPKGPLFCEWSFLLSIPINGQDVWFEGTADLIAPGAAEIIDYKTGSKPPDHTHSAQHHLYCLAARYALWSNPKHHADRHQLDWATITEPLRKFSVAAPRFTYLLLDRMVGASAGAWSMPGFARDSKGMREDDSLAYITELTKRYLDQQPTRLAVAIPAEPPQDNEMGNPQTTAANPFKKATKAAAKLRLALIGPSGSGKTYTALKIATALGKRVAVIDTERGSAAKYADEFSFDVVELERFEPRAYCDLIVAGAEQYDVIVIDSLSHAWAGPGGVLEFVDAKNGNGGSNKFAAWRDATPMHNELVNTILAAKCHIIATMRSKMEYVQEKDERGKVTIRKVGMQPVQREGMEYEFDVIGDLDAATMTVSKTRCKALHDRRFVQPGADVAKLLSEWLGASTPAPAPEQPAAPQFTWGEPRGEGFATDAQIKRIKANCDALGFGPKKVLLTAYGLGTDKNATTVADVTEKIATQLVLKLDALLKATDTPRPDRAPTAEEVLNEEIHKIIGDEIRTKNAKALRDLMTAGSLTPAEVIDTMVNEIGPDPLVFNSLAAPTQEQLLEILKRQANAKAERQLVATGAANGNGNH